MAKKKVKKEVKADNGLEKRVEALEQRLDRIVNAINKSKSVKGM